MDNKSKTLIKGLRLLEYVAAQYNPASTAEIAKEIGLSRTTTYRLLSTLVSMGYIKRDQDGKYSLDIGINKLIKKRFNQLGLIEIANPVLQELRNETGETAVLAQLMGNEIMDIAKIESPRSVRIHAKIGTLIPAHCTATGKAILAFMPESDIKSLYPEKGLKACTENTIPDFPTLRKMLEIVREQGYAMEENEYEIGMKCIAAPVFCEENKVVAAIGIAGLTFRVNQEKTPKIVEIVLEKARRISENLESTSV